MDFFRCVFFESDNLWLDFFLRFFLPLTIGAQLSTFDWRRWMWNRSRPKQNRKKNVEIVKMKAFRLICFAFELGIFGRLTIKIKWHWLSEARTFHMSLFLSGWMRSQSKRAWHSWAHQNRHEKKERRFRNENKHQGNNQKSPFRNVRQIARLLPLTELKRWASKSDDDNGDSDVAWEEQQTSSTSINSSHEKFKQQFWKVFCLCVCECFGTATY